MDVRKAAFETINFAKDSPRFARDIRYGIDHEYERDEHGLNPSHAMWLLSEVVENDGMKNDKANRWLAWAQCLLTNYGFMTLEDCKNINKQA